MPFKKLNSAVAPALAEKGEGEEGIICPDSVVEVVEEVETVETSKKSQEKVEETEDKCVADPVITIEEVDEKPCSMEADKDPPSPVNMMILDKGKSSLRSVAASTQTDDNLVINQPGTTTTQAAGTNDLLWSNHATCGSKRSTMTTFKYLDVDKPLTGIELMVLSDKADEEVNEDKKKLESVPFRSNIVSESELGKKCCKHKGKKRPRHV